MWMVISAMAVSPMLAQEADSTKIEKQQQIEQVSEEPVDQINDEAAGLPSEEEQVDQAIQQATGEVWVDEAIEGEEPPVVEEAVVMQEPQQQSKPVYREVQTLMPESGGGGYGAFSVGYTTVNDLDALSMGVRGAWIIGHGFGLGIAGEGFTSDFTPVESDYYALSGGYGGLLIEPIIMGWFPVHVSFPLVLGGGGMASYSTNSDPWDYDNLDPTFGEYAVFFVGEVGMELEFNMVRFFRLSLYGNYRWTSALEMNPMDGLNLITPYPVAKDALNGWSFGMRFKFGSF